MLQDAINFNLINDHIEKHYSVFDQKSAASLDKSNALVKLCDIYKIVRPLLTAIGMIVIIPKKWRSAIQTFISVMDVVCQ